REAVLHKHHLAHEEVFERETERLVSIWFLFERQFYVTADRESTRVERATIRGFHNSRTTTSDHCKTLGGEESARFLRGVVVRIVGFGACGAEDGDAAAQRGQLVEALDKLAHDAKDAPWICVGKLVRTRTLEQLFVLCRSGNRPACAFFVLFHLDAHDVVAA